MPFLKLEDDVLNEILSLSEYEDDKDKLRSLCLVNYRLRGLSKRYLVRRLTSFNVRGESIKNPSHEPFRTLKRTILVDHRLARAVREFTFNIVELKDPGRHEVLEGLLSALPCLKILHLGLGRFYYAKEKESRDKRVLAHQDPSAFVDLDERIDFAKCFGHGVLHTVYLTQSATVTEISTLMSIPSIETVRAFGVITLRDLCSIDVALESSNIKVLEIVENADEDVYHGMFDVHTNTLGYLLTIPKALKELHVTPP